MYRRIPAILLLLAAVAACSSAASHTPTATSSASTKSNPSATATTTPGPDPKTAAALVRIAQVFNNDYGSGNDGPVYDRWDARSQAVISRAEYIRRHTECATAPQAPAHVKSAAPGPSGAWLVRYEIGGQQFTDYWYYTNQRWAFDLLLSNPSAAQQYRLPFAKYAAAVGCTGH
jgi:hypothetical protein